MTIAQTEGSTIGVQIVRENRYGAEYVTVRVMRREGAASAPLNVGYASYGDEPCLEGLQLEGFVTDYGERGFIAFAPAYRSVYSVDIRRADAMLKVLRRIDRQITKDEAREDGDVFMSFCRALGAKWCVYETAHRGTWLSDSQWRFVTLGEGRNHLRAEIDRAREAAIGKVA